MSGALLGMNPDEVEHLARRLDTARALLENASAAANGAANLSLSPLTYAVQPGGLLLAPGAIAGTQIAAAKIRAALGEVDLRVGRLIAEAAQQRDASGQYSAGIFVRANGAPLPVPPVGASPEVVARWWASLSDDERAAVIESSPDAIRNLDGIPASDRVAANKNWAERHWADEGRSPQEQQYLKEVAEGSRSLYLYDSENERVIEVVGTISDKTNNVVTYVPGTDCSMDSFYDGSAQQFAQGIEDQDVTGGTVVFVYKDGPWVTWSGDRANSNPEFLAQKGRELAEFQATIGVDPDLAGSRNSVISHSAGNTIAAYSEMYGAHYDNYISLAGSWLPPGWEKSSGTEYDHFQYHFDAINLLDGPFVTPNEHGVFQNHDQGLGSVDGLRNHLRIANREGNTSTIVDAYREIIDGE